MVHAANAFAALSGAGPCSKTSGGAPHCWMSARLIGPEQSLEAVEERRRQARQRQDMPAGQQQEAAFDELTQRGHDHEVLVFVRQPDWPDGLPSSGQKCSGRPPRTPRKRGSRSAGHEERRHPSGPVPGVDSTSRWRSKMSFAMASRARARWGKSPWSAASASGTNKSERIMRGSRGRREKSSRPWTAPLQRRNAPLTQQPMWHSIHARSETPARSRSSPAGPRAERTEEVRGPGKGRQASRTRPASSTSTGRPHIAAPARALAARASPKSVLWTSTKVALGIPGRCASVRGSEAKGAYLAGLAVNSVSMGLSGESALPPFPGPRRATARSTSRNSSVGTWRASQR